MLPGILGESYVSSSFIGVLTLNACGSLAQMNVIDLLQSLDLGHKSCLLTLTNDGDRCEIYFTDGQINHAVYGALKGDDAVYKVLGWA